MKALVFENDLKLDENYKLGLVDLNIGLEAVICGYCS